MAFYDFTVTKETTTLIHLNINARKMKKIYKIFENLYTRKI